MFHLNGSYLNMKELEAKMLVLEHALIMRIIEKHAGIQNIRPISNKKSFACGVTIISFKYTIWYEFKLPDGTWSSGLEQINYTGKESI